MQRIYYQNSCFVRLENDNYLEAYSNCLTWSSKIVVSTAWSLYLRSERGAIQLYLRVVKRRFKLNGQHCFGYRFQHRETIVWWKYLVKGLFWKTQTDSRFLVAFGGVLNSLIWQRKNFTCLHNYLVSNVSQNLCSEEGLYLCIYFG